MILGAVGDAIVEAIYKLLILLVAGIYKLVSGFYQIFLVLAKTNIFEQDIYAHLTDKVYIILAVVMLFVVAYNFITMIIDPDKNKSGAVVEKLLKNAVTSLILIVLCPTLFTFAFDLQDAVLDQGIISKFFTVDGEYDANQSIKKGGYMMAETTFSAFFAPAYDGVDASKVKNQSKGKQVKDLNCSSKDKCTLADAQKYAAETGDFSVFTAFAANWRDNEDRPNGMEFSFLMAIIAGGYLIYVIVSFCFDLALRVIKLAFYQIIAPICIACRMLPEKDSIFKSWWKAVSKTYLSVFIRVFIMNLAVFLMVTLTESDFWDTACSDSDCSTTVRLLAYAFLVMGLLMFVKQSSKLIDEIFGLGDVNLGIKDKWKNGTSILSGAASATAAAGFGAAGFVKGTINGKGNPLAGIRAARMNAKNKNLSGNKAEFERRRAYEVALQNGATKSDLFKDYMRGKLGMASLQEQRDYEIDDIMKVKDGHGGTLHYDRVDVEQADGTIKHNFCIVDSAGNTVRTLHEYTAADSALLGREFEYTSRYAQQAKLDSEAADRRIKQLDDEMRSMEQINSSNQAIMGYRKAAMQRVQDKLTEGRSWWGELTDSTTYVDNTGTVHTLSGNYNTLQAGLTELLKRDDISDDEKAKLQKKVSELREKIEFRALNEAATVGGVHADGNIIGQMQKISDAIQAGEFRNLDNSIAISNADIAGKTAEDIVEMVKKNVGRIATDTEVRTRSIKSDRGTEEARKKDIAYVENMHTDTLQQEKQTPDYQGIQASSQHISNNPNVLSSNNGSNKSGSKKNPKA